MHMHNAIYAMVLYAWHASTVSKWQNLLSWFLAKMLFFLHLSYTFMGEFWVARKITVLPSKILSQTL